MSQIQMTRYDSLLRRVADLKGGGSMVNDALSELFPMIDVENVPGELLILAKTDISFGGGNISGAVGTSAKCQVFNPVGSGHLVTVTGARMATATTETMRWGVVRTALATGIGTETFRDTRHRVNSRPTAQVRTEAAAALAPATGQTRRLPNTELFLEDPNGIAVLEPGSGFEMGMTTDNSTLFFTFYWRERVAEPSELNF